MTINQGAATTYVELVTLTLDASGQGGITHMYLSRNGSFADGSWVPYQTSYAFDCVDLATTSTATITFHVKFKDAAGNVSAEATDSIELKRTLVSGTMATATHWTPAASPYYVTATTTFSGTAPLTIDPGTEVYFKAGSKLLLQGGISAVGTASLPIRLGGAVLWLDYARAWVTAGRPPTFNLDGSYARGPHFEHVLANDGEIHIVNVVFDGPGFYMSQCTLGQVTSEYKLDGTYIEHSRITTMGTDSGDLEMANTKIRNSYITFLGMNGYEWPVEITHCQIDVFFIDRWHPDNTLEYNTLKQITWYRPTETKPAVMHNNNIDSAASPLLRVDRGCDVIGVVDATGNYWGATATAQMASSAYNITAIFDNWDDATLDRVDFAGYLTAPVVGAGPDW